MATTLTMVVRVLQWGYFNFSFMSLVRSISFTVGELDLLGFIIQNEPKRSEDGEIGYVPRFSSVQFVCMQRTFEKQAFPLINAFRQFSQTRLNEILVTLPDVAKLQEQLKTLSAKLQGHDDNEEKKELEAQQNEVYQKLQPKAVEAQKLLGEDKEVDAAYNEDLHEITFSEAGLTECLRAFNGFLFAPSQYPNHKIAGDVLEKLEVGAGIKEASRPDKPKEDESKA